MHGAWKKWKKKFFAIIALLIFLGGCLFSFSRFRISENRAPAPTLALSERIPASESHWTAPLASVESKKKMLAADKIKIRNAFTPALQKQHVTNSPSRSSRSSFPVADFASLPPKENPFYEKKLQINSSLTPFGKAESYPKGMPVFVVLSGDCAQNPEEIDKSGFWTLFGPGENPESRHPQFQEYRLTQAISPEKLGLTIEKNKCIVGLTEVPKLALTFGGGRKKERNVCQPTSAVGTCPDGVTTFTITKNCDGTSSDNSSSVCSAAPKTPNSACPTTTTQTCSDGVTTYSVVHNCDGTTSIPTGSVCPFNVNDPYYVSGQQGGPSQSDGVQGNLSRAQWQQGMTIFSQSGPITENALIGEADDGPVDINHPDLVGAIESGGSSSAGGHGEWVAGIMVARTDNGVGIAGVNGLWSKLRYSNNITDTRFMDPALDVLNVSEAVTDNSGNEIPLESNAYYASFFNTLTNNYGVNVVTAGGNSTVNYSRESSRSPGVLVIGSIDPWGSISGYSSYGTGIDLYAVGQQWGTTGDGVNDSGYSFWAGTSGSSPTVAGAVSLLRVYFKNNKILFCPAMINNILIASGVQNSSVAQTTSGPSKELNFLAMAQLATSMVNNLSQRNSYYEVCGKGPITQAIENQRQTALGKSPNSDDPVANSSLPQIILPDSSSMASSSTLPQRMPSNLNIPKAARMSEGKGSPAPEVATAVGLSSESSVGTEVPVNIIVLTSPSGKGNESITQDYLESVFVETQKLYPIAGRVSFTVNSYKRIPSSLYSSQNAEVIKSATSLILKQAGKSFMEDQANGGYLTLVISNPQMINPSIPTSSAPPGSETNFAPSPLEAISLSADASNAAQNIAATFNRGIGIKDSTPNPEQLSSYAQFLSLKRDEEDSSSSPSE